jgi:hypothetical protein
MTVQALETANALGHIARVPWHTAVATDDLQRIGELLLRDGVGEGGHSLGALLDGTEFLRL